MDKKQFVKLAVAALAVGLSTESLQATELNQTVDQTILAGGGCSGKGGCAGKSGCTGKTADNGCSAARSRTADMPPQPNSVRDDFRSHLKTTQSLYDNLSPEERKRAREMVNQNSSKNPDDAVREVYESKSGAKAPK